MYAILGQSGCGKTTLLSLLGGLDSPVDGQILYDGQDIEKLGLANHRKNNVAFIFQSYNLIDYLTPKENVALTAKLSPQPILERVGLTEEECKRNVLKLSGGQQQRVAIARALASDTKVILADEPTGNLDEDTAAEIISIIVVIFRLFISHNLRLQQFDFRNYNFLCFNYHSLSCLNQLPFLYPKNGVRLFCKVVRVGNNNHAFIHFMGASFQDGDNLCRCIFV